MQKFSDKGLLGWALIADGPLDVLDAAMPGLSPGGNRGYLFDDAEWLGRPLADAAALADSFGKPWAEGLATITGFVDELWGADIPEPTIRRRKARFSEVDGDVDVDRVMDRDPLFYREVVRAQRQGPNSITLVCNVGGNNGVSAESMFWRGAAAAAAVDLLEAAGYSVEIIAWNAGTGTFPKNGWGSFLSYRLKESGAPLDMDTLACGLSAWFFRTAMLSARVNSCPGCQPVPRRAGAHVENLGGWEKYLDVAEGVRLIHMGQAADRDSAAAAAREVLAQVQQPQFTGGES